VRLQWLGAGGARGLGHCFLFTLLILRYLKYNTGLGESKERRSGRLLRQQIYPTNENLRIDGNEPRFCAQRGNSGKHMIFPYKVVCVFTLCTMAGRSTENGRQKAYL
jgi:hypothetical protein